MSETLTEPTTQWRYYRDGGFIYRTVGDLVEFDARPSSGASAVWIKSIGFDSEAELVARGAEPVADPIEAKDAEIERLKKSNAELVAALADMNGGWRYIRATHGDLYGVGWDRAQNAAEAALANAQNL